MFSISLHWTFPYCRLGLNVRKSWVQKGRRWKAGCPVSTSVSIGLLPPFGAVAVPEWRTTAMPHILLTHQKVSQLNFIINDTFPLEKSFLIYSVPHSFFSHRLYSVCGKKNNRHGGLIFPFPRVGWQWQWSSREQWSLRSLSTLLAA